MFRSKSKTKENSIQCVTLLVNWSPSDLYPCKNSQKRCIVIQNGRQNEVAVIADGMVSIVMGCKENKTCHGGKKGDVTKFIAASLPYSRWLETNSN